MGGVWGELFSAFDSSPSVTIPIIMAEILFPQ